MVKSPFQKTLSVVWKQDHFLYLQEDLLMKQITAESDFGGLAVPPWWDP
jgi:hypothetical protein